MVLAHQLPMSMDYFRVEVAVQAAEAAGAGEAEVEAEVLG